MWQVCLHVIHILLRQTSQVSLYYLIMYPNLLQKKKRNVQETELHAEMLLSEQSCLPLDTRHGDA